MDRPYYADYWYYAGLAQALLVDFPPRNPVFAGHLLSQYNFHLAPLTLLSLLVSPYLACACSTSFMPGCYCCFCAATCGVRRPGGGLHPGDGTALRLRFARHITRDGRGCISSWRRAEARGVDYVFYGPMEQAWFLGFSPRRALTVYRDDYVVIFKIVAGRD